MTFRDLSFRVRPSVSSVLTAACATSDARGAFRIGELRAGAYRLDHLASRNVQP